MRILRLRLVNYRRHRDTQIEFPDGVTAIVGRNGSGKTSILEAIAFALYGTPATRTQKALIRHDGAAAGDAVRVELDAEAAGQALAVVRELRGVGQTGLASLTVDGQTIVAPQAGSSEAVTEEVTRRIGLDREAFFNTVCAQQKELGRLANKSKADRKRLVLGMLGIDALDRAIQEAGTRRREAQARVEALQERVAGLQDADDAFAVAKAEAAAAGNAAAEAQGSWRAAQQELGAAAKRLQAAREVDERRRAAHVEHERRSQEQRHAAARLQDLAARMSEAEAAAEKAAAMEAAAADLSPARAALEEATHHQRAHERVAEAQRRVTALRQERDGIQVPPAPNGALEAARQRLADVRLLVERRQADRTALATELRLVRDRLRRVDGLQEQAACPVCERPLEGHAAPLVEHVSGELATIETRHAEAESGLHDAKREVEAAQHEAAAAEAVLRRHEEAVAARRHIDEVLGRAIEEHRHLSTSVVGPAPDLAALRARVQAAEAAHFQRARLVEAARGLQRLRGEHEAAHRMLQEATAGCDAAARTLKALPPARLAEIEAEHLAVAGKERSAEREHARCKSVHAAAAARLEAARARRDEARQARARLQEAQSRHREWQALAGTRGTGLLERFRSHLVGRIGPAVAAEASRLLDKFTNGRYAELLLDDDYEIYVTENGVAYQLERFSGGESDLVHLALRLAVSRLLVERSGGAEIRFLALDEVFGSLDDERRSLVLAALQELGTLYSQVLLVTHHEDMRDALDRTLLVEEVDGAAVVRMHNG